MSDELTFTVSTEDSFLYFFSIEDIISAIHLYEDLSGKDFPSEVRFFVRKREDDIVREFNLESTVMQGVKTWGLTDESRRLFLKHGI